jgi:hypothetical protein
MLRTEGLTKVYRLGGQEIRALDGADLEIPGMDVFYVPPGVGLAAIAFGTLIGVLAGLYPASRAARSDPARALRQD